MQAEQSCRSINIDSFDKFRNLLIMWKIWPRRYKTFPMLNSLSTKFILLINVKIPTIVEISCSVELSKKKVLLFTIMDSTIAKLHTCKRSLFYLVSVAEQAILSMIWSETSNSGFLATKITLGITWAKVQISKILKFKILRLAVFLQKSIPTKIKSSNLMSNCL